MSDSDLTIGELARRTGCKVPTVRYYESIGMLPAPARSPGNQRRYGARDLARLDFIQHCRELGFSQSAIKDILGLTDDPAQSCEAVTTVVQGHLDDVTARMERLGRLRDELARMIGECSGGVVGSCRILETLGDHSHKHCMSDSHYR